VNAALLRRALNDVLEADAMTAEKSVMIKIEYLMLMKASDDPLSLIRQMTNEDLNWPSHLPGYLRGYAFLYREPERAQRIGRLYFANWLAECDKPRAVRATISGRTQLFRLAVDSPARYLENEELESWATTSLVAQGLQPSIQSAIDAGDRDRFLVELLKLQVAQYLYEREHGSPPRDLGALVGPYLKQLPEGFVPKDAPMPMEAISDVVNPPKKK